MPKAESSGETDAILAHIEAVAGSAAFASSARSVQLLRYLCDRTLSGEGGGINEYAVGLDVFQRPASFDPRVDSIVRAEMSRLRKRLKQFYDGEAATPIRISLPPRAYTPVFERAIPPAVAAVQAPPHLIESRNGLRLPVWIAMTSAAIALALVAGYLFRWTRIPGVHPAGPSIAVLPFLNLSGDPGKEYLADSITDELTENLAEAKGLRVVARTSSFQFKNKARDVRDMGRILNVSAVLEGSVQPGTDRFRVIAQLIRTTDGYHLWSHTYDEPQDALQNVETQIAASAAQALLPPAGESNATAHPLTTSSPEAHDLYLQSIYQLQQRTPTSLQASLHLAEKAVTLDPGYVRAYGAIVRAERSLEPLRLVSPEEAAQRSEAALEKALQLDPGYSDGHAWMGYDAYIRNWDWARAEREFKLALAADGSHGQVDNLYGWSLITRKRFREARAHLQVAEDLDPMSPGSRANMVIALIFERDFEGARREVKRMFEMNPKSLPAFRELSWIELLQGNCRAARAAAQQVTAWYPDLKDATESPTIEAACGQPETARREIANMETESNGRFVSPYLLAEASAAMKDTDRAIGYLERSAEMREGTLLYLEVDTLLDPLRSDPRFRLLERRLGLVE